MSVEFFDCGVLYRGVLSPKTAQRTGRLVNAFRQYNRSSFFRPPFNAGLGTNSRVLKAWLTNGESGPGTFPALVDDYDVSGPEQTWGALAVLELLLVVEYVQDRVILPPADRSFLQTYPPDTKTSKHDDKGKASCVVGLSGVGVFSTFADLDTAVPTEVVPIGPGDVFHFYGQGIHDAVNPSRFDIRNTLNIILVEPAD